MEVGTRRGITNSEQLQRCYTLNRKQAKCWSKAAVVRVGAGGGCGHRSRTSSRGKSTSPSRRFFFLCPPFPFYQGSPSLIPAEVSSLGIKILIQINKATSLKTIQRENIYEAFGIGSRSQKKILFWTEDPVLSPDPLPDWDLKRGTSFHRLSFGAQEARGPQKKQKLLRTDGWSSNLLSWARGSGEDLHFQVVDSRFI